ncbi:MAG TPA: hypothetical protein PLN85_00205 [archaeon]|nr:hypothetical protein [archaeon]
MGFIDKNDPTVINIKLTSKGRELLSQGKLNYKYFVVGDSEIDYRLINEINKDSSDYSGFDSVILNAFDKNPNIISSIPRNFNGDSYNEIQSIPITNYTVENSIDSIGFFNSGCTGFIIDSNHIKRSDLFVKPSEINGGSSLNLYKGNDGILYDELLVDDYILIMWSVNTTTADNINKNTPNPILIYKIEEIFENNNDYIFVKVDRDLPIFSGYSSSIITGKTNQVIVFPNKLTYSGSSVFNMSQTDYVDNSVINFLENCQCPTIVFPFWNMSIIFTEEIIGISTNNLKYTKFKNKSMGGFVSYIQNQNPTYKKLGVIHYTNNSPANVYGEGFLLDNVKLEIPTIMWHKNITPKLGLTLTPKNGLKLLTGDTKSLNINYYDLCDNWDNVVGKVFPDLKIFVIEDQELLFALSYKSNRSWTLPNFKIS